MGAETTYYVYVVKKQMDWVKVQAVTSEEALAEAEKLPDVMMAMKVKHHFEYEHREGGG